MTRAKVSSDTVQGFETMLINYFAQDSLIEAGLPDVKYFATALNLSPTICPTFEKVYWQNYPGTYSSSADR